VMASSLTWLTRASPLLSSDEDDKHEDTGWMAWEWSWRENWNNSIWESGSGGAGR
jgi:hypothetical protein